MRLLNSFNDERKAFACSNFFRDQGIETLYESSLREGATVYSIWIIEEDDFEKAAEALAKFEALPPEALLRYERPKQPTPSPKIITSGKPSLKVQLERQSAINRGRYILTYFFIALCVFLYLLNSIQEARLAQQEGNVALQVGLTPLQRDLVFDFPSCFASTLTLLQQYPLKSLDEIKTLPAQAQLSFLAAEHCPYWKGAFDIFFNKLRSGQGSYTNAPLFEKIRQGEVWRLFTPCLLHRDFLHILFNMAWLLVLGRMIEDRIGRIRMFAMILIIGIISNVAQYLMSGPYFLGFSGIVCGMVGFIWMRQRMSPWEGYPLSGGTILFLLIFVIAMLILQWVSLGLELFGVQGIASNIANTAHIVGGLAGLALARIPIFSRSPT